MAFKYKSGTLVESESLKAEGGCLSICVTAVAADATFTLNDGDLITVRSGNEKTFTRTTELDSALIACISGQIDVLIEYSI